MSTYVHSTELVAPTRPLFDESRLAVTGFLARYSGQTRVSYAADRRHWFTWCDQVGPRAGRWSVQTTRPESEAMRCRRAPAAWIKPAPRPVSVTGVRRFARRRFPRMPDSELHASYFRCSLSQATWESRAWSR
jgi:hypothetical protein